MQNSETKTLLPKNQLSTFPGKERVIWICLVAEVEWAGRILNLLPLNRKKDGQQNCFLYTQTALGLSEAMPGCKQGWSQQCKYMLALDPTQLGKFILTGWDGFQKTTISFGGSSQRYKLWLSITSLFYFCSSLILRNKTGMKVAQVMQAGY